MKIESIDIKHFFYGGFSSQLKSASAHTKSLPYLSVVQSKVGSYGIKLDNEEEHTTGEGNFFIAPSMVTQKITHYINKSQNLFVARYVFLDVIINKKYSFDDIFDIPVVIDKNTNIIFDKLFDQYESSDCVCTKMQCLYEIIKILIGISKEKKVFRNDKIYPLTEYIKENYYKNITISQMANIMNMSESNLFAIFKKTTGMSPVKYLNQYRLTIACELLQKTDYSIKEIAEKVGIPDQFYFSKLFKSKHSISPQQYRQINLY